MLNYGNEIRVASIQEFHQEVFDLDIVVSAGKTQARGSLKSAACGVVKLRDKCA
jgi:hypothetical protein